MQAKKLDFLAKMIIQIKGTKISLFTTIQITKINLRYKTLQMKRLWMNIILKIGWTQEVYTVTTIATKKALQMAGIQHKTIIHGTTGATTMI